MYQDIKINQEAVETKKFKILRDAESQFIRQTGCVLCATCEVLTAVLLKIPVFGDVTLFPCINSSWGFGKL